MRDRVEVIIVVVAVIAVLGAFGLGYSAGKRDGAFAATWRCVHPADGGVE